LREGGGERDGDTEREREIERERERQGNTADILLYECGKQGLMHSMLVSSQCADVITRNELKM
jgi:hypothetical protein